jgi:hypothetical protein
MLRVRLMTPPRIAAPVVIPAPLVIALAALRAGPPLVLAVPLLVVLLAHMLSLARAAAMLGSLNLDFLGAAARLSYLVHFLLRLGSRRCRVVVFLFQCQVLQRFGQKCLRGRGGLSQVTSHAWGGEILQYHI